MVHGANMGPTWVLSAPDRPHDGHINLAIRDDYTDKAGSYYLLKFLSVRFHHNTDCMDGCHFPDDIFKWIFLNENVWISINISPKFVPMGPINNTPTLVQVMAWRRLGDKPLSEQMMVRLPTHICVTRPQWFNCLCRLNNEKNITVPFWWKSTSDWWTPLLMGLVIWKVFPYHDLQPKLSYSNSLWFGIWQYKSESILAQVMSSHIRPLSEQH